MTTGKTVALTMWTFVSKVISLLFNILSRFIRLGQSRNSVVAVSGGESKVQCCKEQYSIGTGIGVERKNITNLDSSLVSFPLL